MVRTYKIMKKLFAFNRFPINKDIFFKILEKTIEDNNDISTLFMLVPRMYDRIYVTVTDKELLSIEERYGEKNLLESLSKWDALFSISGRFIVLHVPSMIRKTSLIPSRDDDPKRHMLFTIHFFACLFHELGHSNDLAVNSIFSNKHESDFWRLGETEADIADEECLHQFEKFLNKKGIGWSILGEHLFDWDKLDSIISRIS